MGKTIVFYNHKGGVGKTTLVHNLAFALADVGKKVLLIDADPQMNLTSAVYGLSTAVEYSSEEGSKWNRYIEQYISLKEYFDIYLKEDKPENPQKNMFNIPSREGKGEIDLISGSIMLSELEGSLYEVVKTNNEFTKNIPYRFEQSIRQKAKEYEFVLIDTSPSASSIINALFIMSCDYFITPVSPAFFSLQAIDNLSAVLKNWIDLLHPYQTTQLNRGLSFKPQFLGMVVQMAKRFNSGAFTGTGYSSSTEAWIEQVNESVKRFLSFARSRGMAVSEEEFKRIFSEATPFVIEKCCDFTQQLREIAEKEGVPVIYLTQDICNKHRTKRASVNIVNEKTNEKNQYYRSFQSINQSYRRIAENLTKL